MDLTSCPTLSGESKRTKHMAIVTALKDLESRIRGLETLRDTINDAPSPAVPKETARELVEISLSSFLSVTPKTIEVFAERIGIATNCIREEIF